MSKAKVFNKKVPIASYDESDCYDAAINHLIEDGTCSTEEEAIEHTEFNWHFHDYCEMYWFDMEEAVKEACKKYLKKGAGLVCPSFGWSGAVGTSKYFEVNAFNAFKQVYLDGDFSLKVYLKRNHLFGVHLEVVIYHHDSPSGDHVFIVSQEYYEQFIQEHFGQKAA